MPVTCCSNLLSDTKEDESVLPALSMREVDLMPVPYCRLCCMIKSASEDLAQFYIRVNILFLKCIVLLLSCRGNFTVPKLSESNMGFGVLGVFLGLLLEVSTHGPHAVPRTSWRNQGKAEFIMFTFDM